MPYHFLVEIQRLTGKAHVRHVSGRMDGRSRPSASGARRPAASARPQGALGCTRDSPGKDP